MDDFDISPFQHISKDYIYHTHHLLIIMAKTYRTNPHHSDEPPRRSNRTAGKSLALSIDLPARKPAKRKKTTAAREDTAASPSKNSDTTFIGERSTQVHITLQTYYSFQFN